MRDYTSIGSLAKATGVKIVTIRYYERIGLLPAPARTGGNYRVYGREHTIRLRFIRRCRDLGFTLEQVRDLLRLSSENAQPCADICALAARHLEDLEAKLASLSDLALELRRIRSSCGSTGSVAECRIVEALSQG